MLGPLRIAVISDLHIGTKARALDLCPHDLPPEKKVGLPTDFVSRFKNHVASPAFRDGGPIDFLFVTGDISNQADPKEFRRAHEVVLEIAAAIALSEDKVFYVPGNHDVHWPVMTLTPASFWRRFRYEPLLEDGLIFKTRMAAADHGSYQVEPHFVIWNTPALLVIGINSAAFDAPVAEHGKHNGLVSEETIAALDSELRNRHLDNNQLRVCLLHHHPIQYSDPYPNFPDYSALTNAGNLFELFTKHRVDLVVHGHKHVPHISHQHATTNGHPVTVLGAGSFSAQLESQWVGTTHNQFHVVNVKGRDQRNGAAYGHVETWNYEVGGAWRASYAKSGLSGTEGFGSLTTPAEIIAEISPVVDEILASEGSCPWQDVERRLPHAAHINTRRAYEAFSHIAGAKGLKIFGGIETPSEAWVLLPARKQP